MTRAPAYAWRDQRTVPPPLDMWRAVRALAPDVDDHAARHCRGVVTMPWTIQDVPGERQGDVVPAWVCCDPACAGVELTEYLLERNHFCCHVYTVDRVCMAPGGSRPGPYAPYWSPTPEA